MEINDTTLKLFNETVNETSVLDVNGTISKANSSVIENTTQDNVINSTTASTGLPKWFCKGRNNSQSNDSVEQRVVMVNAEELLQRINTTVDNETDSCAVVLFYTQYCPFCAKLAPLYNALGRVYNNLPILAVDAYKQHRSVLNREGGGPCRTIEPLYGYLRMSILSCFFHHIVEFSTKSSLVCQKLFSLVVLLAGI